MARAKGRSSSGGRMQLRAHLVEFRKRLVLSALGLVVGAVAGWLLYEPVFRALMQPLLDAGVARQGDITLNFSGVATSFDMKIRVSLFLGLLITSPWWLYQLWAFITPGLTRKERFYAISFLTASVPLFLLGAYFAWWALPNAVNLLTEFTPSGAVNYIDAQGYLTFVMQLILAFGIAFLLPVVMVALNFVGLVQARTWARGWRWSVMFAFVFAAIMTPTPDVVTMVALAIPICLLYVAAVVVCRIHDRRVDRGRLAQGLPRLDGAFPDDRDRAGSSGLAEPTALRGKSGTSV